MSPKTIGRVLLIVFDDNRPFYVITEVTKDYHDEWAFDYSRRAGVVYYHNTGSGPAEDLIVDGGPADGEAVLYWAASDVAVVVNGNALRLPECPAPYTPDNLFTECQESETEYCRVCNDHFASEMECRHIQWISELGSWGGCGSQDLEAIDHRDSFIKLLGVMGHVTQMRDALKAHGCHFRTYGPCIGGPVKLEFKLPGHYWQSCATFDYPEPMELQAGALWLLSLEDGKTAEYDDITVSWIDEYLADQQTAPGASQAVAP